MPENALTSKTVSARRRSGKAGRCWALSAFRNLLTNGLSQECQSNEKYYETNAHAETL
jgi:hypothetical protein